MVGQLFTVQIVKSKNYIINLIIFFIIIIAFLKVSLVYSKDFLDCIQDVPLIENLNEKEESCFYFDSDDGRVANVEAEGLVEKSNILSYYKNILPQLGWKDDKKSSIKNVLKFTRGKEILRISIISAGDKIIVTFFSFLISNQ